MSVKVVANNVAKAHKTRAFLKWAGGKYSLIDILRQHLPQGKRLIEPFVGAGSVFLNTDYDEYLLNDINPDLINLYRILQSEPLPFIRDAAALFVPDNNDADRYYRYRQQFNGTVDKYERALLFLYLNRHGYNGLCRYNKKGGFNVPFGRYKRPYFPERELRLFAEKAKRAEFTCEPFELAMRRAEQPSDVVYCDPPYAPLTPTANFTSYHEGGFDAHEQLKLAQNAAFLAREYGVNVLISNHDVPATRQWYESAKLQIFNAKRSISRVGAKRRPAKELLAHYQPTQRLSGIEMLNVRPKSALD